MQVRYTQPHGWSGVLDTEGLDHYATAMQDPEGNEFDIN